ncbi:MAG: hypothetical protein ABIE70_05605 [bacterium]
MNRRVLLAESSEAIRGVAEPVLRQNGYEVISVATAEKALQVLEFSRPNLIIAGAGLQLQSGQPFHERLAADDRLSRLPLLLVAEASQADSPVPPENVIVLPFEPSDLVSKAQALIGSPNAGSAGQPKNPLGGACVDDDLIDAALGLDRIEVTDSEVMDETMHTRRRREMDNGLAAALSNDELGETGRVESIVISDDTTDIVAGRSKSGIPREPSDSNKLDILSEADQYALSSSEDLQAFGEGRDHDYDWFINEMRRDTHSDAASGSADDGKFSVESLPDAELSFEDHASQTEGVSQFLDEFKREVKKLDLDLPESLVIRAEGETVPDKSSENTQWVDSLETITGDQLEIFTKEFAQELAERVATKIVDKIDTIKLLNLIKSEVITRTKQKSGA